MELTEKIETILSDPLESETRKIRKMLLGISAISFLITKMSIVPTKISALGIELSETNQQSILGLLIVSMLYYFIGFIFYSSSDFYRWIMNYKNNYNDFTNLFKKIEYIQFMKNDMEKRIADLNYKKGVLIKQQYEKYKNTTEAIYISKSEENLKQITKDIKLAEEQYSHAKKEWGEYYSEEDHQLFMKNYLWYKNSRFMAIFRIIFDIIVPAVVGIYIIFLLILNTNI